MIIKKISKKQAGDTIIEVLIAIAVAAFAIGTSYAISNRSLQNAIAARERNEALNNMENQISALKLRWKKTPDKTAFNTQFGAASTNPITFKHFCLDATASQPSDLNWGPIDNNGAIDSSTPLGNSGSPSYKTGCTDQGTYYIDIVAQQTTASQAATNPTVFQVNVRWPQVGTGATNTATIYYRF